MDRVVALAFDIEERFGVSTTVLAPAVSARTPTRPPIRAPRNALNKLSVESAPALFAGLFLSAGILLAQRIWIVPGIVLTATVLAAAVTLLAARSTARAAWLPLACCWLLLGLFLNEIELAPDAQRSLAALADSGGAHSIEGEITRTTPVRHTRSTMPFSTKVREEQSESIDIRIDSVDGKAIAGGLRASIYAPAQQIFPAIRCGDAIHANLEMHLPERYFDPGVWDSNAWLLGQGIGAVGALKASVLNLRHTSGHGTWGCRLHSLQQAGTQRLLDFAGSDASLRMPAWLRLSTEDAGMLAAMILGDRTYLNRQARLGFERTGSFHLLVVSGMHLALFAGFIFALAALLRLPGWAAAVLTIACSFAYALLTGFGAPVQRSFWMVTLFLIARFLFRERNSLNAIGFAALCLLAKDPRSILGASFEMTLLSVLVIAGIVLPITEHSLAPYLRAMRNLEQIEFDPTFTPRLAQFRVTLRLIADHLQPILGRRAAQLWFPAGLRLAVRLCELLLVSASIELAMSLPMAVYFHRVTLLALPVNIFVVPLIAAALPAALIAFAAILVSPYLAIVPTAITAALLHSITAIVRLFGGMPAGDIRIPSPGALAVLASILLLGFAVWAARNGRFPASLSMAALACSALCVLYPRSLIFHPGTLEITAIDVGQGDSLLLISPQGKTLLIDAGGPIGGAQTAASNFDIGEDVVSPVLWTRNIRHLDAVELTHAHSDHMGGMPAVLRNFRPKELWVGKNPPIPEYDDLLDEARGLGIAVRSWAAGDAFEFGGAKVQVLSPAQDYVPGRTASNDDSLVIRVTYGHTSALMEGDAQAKSEVRMLGEDLHSDLLKVGHHGSKTSTIPPFLTAVDPRYAIISVGHRNPYGHPKIEVLDRLQGDHVKTFRTDALGAASFFLDGNTVTGYPLAER